MIEHTERELFDAFSQAKEAAKRYADGLVSKGQDAFINEWKDLDRESLYDYLLSVTKPWNYKEWSYKTEKLLANLNAFPYAELLMQQAFAKYHLPWLWRKVA